jgi:hypothetical protein
MKMEELFSIETKVNCRLITWPSIPEILKYSHCCGVASSQEEDEDVGGSTILIWIFERYVGVVWTGLIRLRRESSGGLM